MLIVFIYYGLAANSSCLREMIYIISFKTSRRYLSLLSESHFGNAEILFALLTGHIVLLH